MKEYEFSAKTEDEAVELGLQELGLSIADVEIRVLEEGSKGLFGLFGSRPVKIRMTVKDTEEDPLANLLEDKKPEKGKECPKREKVRCHSKCDCRSRKTSGGRHHTLF